MNKYFLPLILVLTTLTASDPLTEFTTTGSTFHVAKHSPTQTWIAQINTYTLYGLSDYSADQWHTLDVSGFAPGAQAVFLSVVLIITHGQTAESCVLGFYVRNWGDDTIAWGPASQLTVPLLGDGGRMNYTDWVSVTDGKFDFKWTTTTPGTWPEHCSYGLAIRVSAYAR